MYVYSCVDRLNTEGGRDPASWLMLGDPTGYFSKLPQISSDLAYICIYIYMLKLRCLVTHEKLVLDPWCFPCLWTSIATTHTHTHKLSQGMYSRRGKHQGARQQYMQMVVLVKQQVVHRGWNVQWSVSFVDPDHGWLLYCPLCFHQEISVPT